MADPVDSVTKIYLKGEGFFEKSDNATLPAGLLPMAVVQEIMSPLAIRADAGTEADRQLAFLGGPLVRDIHIVQGARRDLQARPITLKGDQLDYAAGIPCFVIGFKELDDGTTELTVLRKAVP